MTYEERIQKMDKHLEEHPHDYQTVIARLKTKSDAIEHKRKESVNGRLRNLAEIKRQLRERKNERREESDV